MYKTYASIKKKFGIDCIHGNKLFMEDKRCLEIYEVVPVNYLLVNEHDKHLLIRRYQMALNALEYPVQMIAANVEANIRDYINILGLNKDKDKDYIKELKVLFVQKNVVKRKYYFIIDITNHSFSNIYDLFEKTGIKLKLMTDMEIQGVFKIFWKYK